MEAWKYKTHKFNWGCINVTHDWMVENINLLGASLQQYVKTFYSATYAAVGSDPTVYEDLMYK